MVIVYILFQIPIFGNYNNDPNDYTTDETNDSSFEKDQTKEEDTNDELTDDEAVAIEESSNDFVMEIPSEDVIEDQ